MYMLEYIWILLLIILILLLVSLLVWGLKKGVILAMNSVIGFFALHFVQIFSPTLKINFWSVIITAIGGIIGFIVVVGLHLLNIAF